MNVIYSKLYEQFDAAIKDYNTVIMSGGSHSGKTHSIVQWLIAQCLKSKSPINIAIYQEKKKHIDDAIFQDFKEILKNEFNLWDRTSFNSIDLEHKLNGCEFHFCGLDDYKKMKELSYNKYDYIYFNRCLDMTYDEYREITIRNCGKNIIEFNSALSNHWIYQHIMTKPKAKIIKSTYKDNPFLSADIIDTIERYEPTQINISNGTADSFCWKTYCLGEVIA